MGRHRQLHPRLAGPRVRRRLAQHAHLHPARPADRLRDPLRAGPRPQRTPPRQGVLPGRRLPARDDPARGERPAVEVVLRPGRRPRQRGAAPSPPADLELVQRRRHGPGVPGDRRHLGQHGRHRAHLPRRAPVHPRRAVRGRRTRRGEPAPARPARHRPADPVRHPHADAAADHRHHAGVHRTVRDHRGGPENATVTVLYLIYKYAFLYNDFGGACALSVMLLALLGAFSAVYLRLTRSGEEAAA